MGRAFIVCLAIAFVSGDAKPYTLKQVAEGLPVKNAIADRRLHNVGVITNAAEAGVKTVGAVPVGLPYAALPYAATPVVYHHTAYPYTLHHLGKREAEPYTLGQVAAGNPVVYAHTAYPYYGGVYYG